MFLSVIFLPLFLKIFFIAFVYELFCKCHLSGQKILTFFILKQAVSKNISLFHLMIIIVVSISSARFYTIFTSQRAEKGKDRSLEATDGQVVRAGISVTQNVLL